MPPDLPDARQRLRTLVMRISLVLVHGDGEIRDVDDLTDAEVYALWHLVTSWVRDWEQSITP